MALTYVGIAYLAVFTPVLIRYNETNDSATDQHLLVRWLFGITVFVYGLVRGHRTYKQLNKHADDADFRR
ncbi:hypothetical protein FACS189467_8030 [Bacteroidia bacterium]|nr:hypothetical protein FACS189467_8030 [Bacteroidia bacterium]